APGRARADVRHQRAAHAAQVEHVGERIHVRTIPALRRTDKKSRLQVILRSPKTTYGDAMDISTTIPVVTGASRGLGRQLVDALLSLGADKVYALARDTGTVRRDPRVVPVRFDLTDVRAIEAAAARCSDATLLINNASTAEFAGPLDADP